MIRLNGATGGLTRHALVASPSRRLSARASCPPYCEGGTPSRQPAGCRRYTLGTDVADRASREMPLVPWLGKSLPRTL